LPALRPTPSSSSPSTADNPGGQSANTGGGGFGSLVCKHWLRGLCKKGLTCEFLHEYNLRKMPECNFFVRNGYCSNGDECLYLHIDPSSKLPPCPHYDRGFCPLGPRCDKRHLKRNICLYYLAGFCPDGKQCKQGAHPRWTRDELMEKPTVKVEKTAEELEREEQERERHRERERERDMERRAERDRERGDGDRHERGHDKGATEKPATEKPATEKPATEQKSTIAQLREEFHPRMGEKRAERKQKDKERPDEREKDRGDSSKELSPESLEELPQEMNMLLKRKGQDEKEREPEGLEGEEMQESRDRGRHSGDRDTTTGRRVRHRSRPPEAKKRKNKKRSEKRKEEQRRMDTEKGEAGGGYTIQTSPKSLEELEQEMKMMLERERLAEEERQRQEEGAEGGHNEGHDKSRHECADSPPSPSASSSFSDESMYDD
ncbi:hypothetical protein B0T21DRAFT_419502, partial [Apiosordaria backusii]